MNPILAQYAGFWWPASDTDAHGVIARDCAPSIAALLPHIRGRDFIVQAGGNVGLYPVALADHFQRVLTFEPDPTNFQCLAKNLDARDSLGRVVAMPVGLGAIRGWAGMHPVSKGNCGAHRLDVDGQGVEVWTLDELALPHCDAIWLDVEGFELPALQGAEATIQRFSPVICVEDKGLHRAFGIADGALQEWLAEHGYEQVDRIGNDKVFKRKAS